MIADKFKYICVDCKKEYPHAFNTFCEKCKGLIDVEYNLSNAAINQDSNPFLRYFDLLPILDKNNLICLDNKKTPCIRAHTLGKLLCSDNIYLKDETKNPTGTTKDRMASIVLSSFKELGITKFVASSTGNSSVSLATIINKHPFSTLYIVIGSEFADRLDFEITQNIKLILLEGATFDEASTEAGKFAKAKGIVNEAGFFNPARREGLKITFMEACDQMERSPDWYFQAVSSAMGVYGVYKAAKQYYEIGRISRIPQFCCIQQDTCCPMVKAWEEDSRIIEIRHIFKNPSGLAKAILRGNPEQTYPYIYDIVKECGGTFVMVSQKEIREAQELVMETEKIAICATSACTIAALKKMLENGTVTRDEVVLVNLTGMEKNNTGLHKSISNIEPIRESEWRSENFWLEYNL